ncbi:MAG: alpha/beta hydrolase [Desulfuromonas sp.]|uniref:alpha/beta hydrolase n=1 Tax=Desulfuromonas sp. TaxID=892 RepID=UPI000CB53D06|nr:alpha/beta hydrolase [Desulfuromonas sp.]PLX83748.1 MAG: alpha/beta hydrolase [Desulfuromonas sp.]
MSESILNHPVISERYFFPRPSQLADPFWVDCGDARLACSYHEIDPQARTVVHFHGNGEIVEDYLGDFVSLVHGMGCNLLLAELRGYGASTGRPELGRMLDDVGPTLRSLGQPPERLILFGRSVGSIFALHGVSLFPQAAGLILESGVADVLERLLLRLDPAELGVSPAELEAAVAARLDHRAKLTGYRGPSLVMHTLHDGLVDVSHGRRLHEWAAGPKTLKIFPRGNHNDIMFVNAREYFDEVAAFVAQL